jgi:hypothetical protein
MAEPKDNPSEPSESAAQPRMKILGEVRDGVYAVLDTETGTARLAYRRPKPRKTSPFRSFLDGFASAFDIFGGLSPRSDYTCGFGRDAEAIAGDWWQVGDALRTAMGRIELEIADEQRK